MSRILAAKLAAVYAPLRENANASRGAQRWRAHAAARLPIAAGVSRQASPHRDVQNG